MTAFDDAVAALNAYNSGTYNADTNPKGYSGVGGMDANWVPTLRHVATVATGVSELADQTAQAAADGIAAMQDIADGIAGSIADTVVVSSFGETLVASIDATAARVVLGAVSSAEATAAAAGEITSTAVKQGKHTLAVLGSGLTPRTANGCTAATYEVTTASYDDKGTEAEFDYAVAQAGYVSVPLPKSYNGGSLTYDARGRLLTATSGQTASLRVYARIVNAGTDPATVAWGTPQAVTLTATATAGALLASAASSALTATGTFSDGAELRLKIERDVATGTATTSKLRLRDLRILIGINAATDD